MQSFDAVIIGGGLAGLVLARTLQDAGRRCCVVAEGLSLSDPYPSALRTGFRVAGGVLLAGDSALRGDWDGRRLLRVYTRNLGDAPLEASQFALCTGKFFGRGLLSTMDRIYEPVFGADVFFDPERTRWYDPDFSRPQPFESFGVMTAPDGRVLFGGEPAENLWAAGEVVSGLGLKSGFEELLSRVSESARKVSAEMLKEK